MANIMTTDNLVELCLEFTSLQSSFNQSPIALTIDFKHQAERPITQGSMDCHPVAQLDASPRQTQTNLPLLSESDNDINPGHLDSRRRFVNSPLAPNARMRRNREGTIFGNNRYGRNGTPRCDKCRQRKAKVSASRFLVGLILVCLCYSRFALRVLSFA